MKKGKKEWIEKLFKSVLARVEEFSGELLAEISPALKDFRGFHAENFGKIESRIM